MIVENLSFLVETPFDVVVAQFLGPHRSPIYDVIVQFTLLKFLELQISVPNDDALNCVEICESDVASLFLPPIVLTATNRYHVALLYIFLSDRVGPGPRQHFVIPVSDVGSSV